ncbi:MAG: Ig-like domain-containing protein [Gemmatimonadaceae bacterium]
MAQTTAGLVALVIAASPVAAQRAAPPAGAEIAQRARVARLDRANAALGQFAGKRISLVPADRAALTEAALAGGQVIGVMTTEVAGDETGLPSGTYDLFAVRLTDGWHVYAESGGRVVREALRVRIERRPGARSAADRVPRFREKGWGWDVVCCEGAIDGGDLGSGGATTLVPVAAVLVSPGVMTLPIGASQQLAIAVLAADGSALASRAVTWTSSDPSVVAVFGVGGVTAVRPGNANVVATSEGRSGGATVTIPAPPPEPRLLEGYVTLSPYGGSVPVTRAIQFQATAFVRGCPSMFAVCPPIDYSALIWTSSDTTVARVRRLTIAGPSATVTGIAEGIVTLTARYAPSSVASPYVAVSPTFAGSVPISVTRAPVSIVVVAPTTLRLPAGGTRQLAATVRDATGTVLQRPVTWSSSDATVASVSAAGLVAATAPGVATMTATAEGAVGGASVIVDPVAVSAVVVTPSSASVAIGGSVALSASVRDATGSALSGRVVTWTTSNPTIASVAPNGLVTGVGAGSATVTAMSEGRSGSAAVSVARAKKGVAATTSATAYATLSFDW